MQLWEKRESLAIENLPAWLYTVVRFKVIKLMQRAEVGERYADELGRLAEDFGVVQTIKGLYAPAVMLRDYLRDVL